MAKKTPKRKPNKRRRRAGRGPGIIKTFFALALIIGAVLCATTIFFKVEQVVIVGESRYPNADIAAAAQVDIGDNLFFIDKFSVTRRIFADRPYLGEVKIRRVLPDTIEIHIKDSAVAASVRLEDGYYLMDESGKILENVTEDVARNNRLITGIEAEQIEIGKKVIFQDKDKEKVIYSILNNAKNSGILENIIGINIEKMFEISIQYTNRFTVLLGTTEELDKKIGFLQKVIEELGAADTGVIDLTDARTARFRPQ